jgi:hypothetical protein
MMNSSKFQQITEENIILEYRDGYYIDNNNNKYLLVNGELILQPNEEIKN